MTIRSSYNLNGRTIGRGCHFANYRRVKHFSQRLRIELGILRFGLKKTRNLLMKPECINIGRAYRFKKRPNLSRG